VEEVASLKCGVSLTSDRSESGSWRLLDLECLDPHFNLAVDEAVVRCVSEQTGLNTLRFWRNMNAVVVGRFQCVRLEVDLEACNRLGVKVVRRLTGGGAVYQDLGNLNYSITVSKDGLGAPLSQSEFYSLLLQGVVEGLSTLGVSAKAEEGRGIWANGKKIAGIAGFTNRKLYFGHGTLLVNSDLRAIPTVLKQVEGRSIKGPIRSIPSQVIDLHTLLGFLYKLMS